MRVQFADVGRSKACWIEELPDLSYFSVLKALRKRKVLASREVDIEYDKGAGIIIVGGFREVGRFHILPEQP